MQPSTAILISVYFIVGGIATAIINKRKPGGAKERWKKYIVYFVIVFAMLAIIDAGLFRFAALAIVAAGAYEIIRIGRKHYKTMMVAIVVYVLIASLFVSYASHQILFSATMLYVVVLTFDGFCQIFGQLFGKTKLAPKVSPGKTIEGLVGGLLVAVTTAAVIWNSVLFGILICIAALIGDLLASYYKRKCGVKDYSNLIPGHGGVLDRFDSLIFAGACSSLFLYLWIA